MLQDSKNKLILSAIIVIVVAVAGIFISTRMPDKTNSPVEIPNQNTEENSNTVSIQSVEIKESNFTGKKPIISGEGEMVIVANKYIEDLVSEFKGPADIDVPNIRKEFGADTPTANYSLEIGAIYQEGEKTESIVMSIYNYTGGANGHSMYKVITASKKTGKILSLSDIIIEGQEVAFTNLVKKELLDFRSGGIGGINDVIVFEDIVKDLKFYNFSNWSLSDKNLTLYFAKYEVGPGVLGAVVLPIPVSEMDGMFETAY